MTDLVDSTDAPIAGGFPHELFCLLARLPVAVAIIGSDLDGTVTQWNEYAEVLYGWSSDAAIGRPISDLTVGPVQQDQADEIMSQLKSGRPWVGTFRARRSDGEYVVINILNVALVDRNGQVCGLAGFSREIREQIDESLKELADLRDLANRLDKVRSDEGRRIAGALHDDLSQRFHLVATLTSELLAEELSPTARDLVERLAREQRGCASMIQTIWTGLRPPLLDAFGPSAAIEHLVQQCKRGRGIDVHLRIDAAVEEVSPEMAELVLAIINEGLANVARHSAAGTAWVSLDVHERVVSLSVEDDGIGVDGSPSGFGLRLMRERVRRVGGEVSVATRAEGGTSLRVAIPSGTA